MDSTRKSESKLTKFHMDIASSIQKIIEDIVIKLGTHIIEETGQKNLCLAGGVALNCVANGKLNEEKLFDNIWIQPAAGDAGGAIGAALSFWHIHHRKKRKFNLKKDGMSGSFLGPSFQNFEVKNYLQSVNAKFYELSNQDLVEKVSYELSKNKAIGWMQGKMEFGPRALGNRSIIADPRSPDMQKILNKKVKFRESFRPFAPSVLKEFSHKWFEQNFESPYMLFVSKLKKSKCIKMNEIEKRFFGIKKLNVKRSNVPAITHVDYSARIQTVDRSDNLNSC